MRARSVLLVLLGACLPLATARSEEGGRAMEKLDRGLVVLLREDGSAFLSWRLLGTDPPGIAFIIDRVADTGPPVRLTPLPLGGPTCFVDESEELKGGTGLTYTLRAVVQGRETGEAASVALPPGAVPRPYLSIPLRTLEGCAPNDASVGDLDGDGSLELVLKQEMRPRDNAQRGATGRTQLEAYRLDGGFLWRIDLGKNIREGAHYTPFLVYDFDGDGRAEVACRTADGTVDGRGHTIGKADADHRNEAGTVLEGPEFLTVFDGRTGAALDSVDYVPPRGDLKSWGDTTGNRADRFLACVAYLDGRRPSLVMCRGYYERTALAAWDFHDGRLAHLWTFDTGDGRPGLREYEGQGNHGLSVADVDGDLKDEILFGSCCIDDDGKGLYSTGLGHGDALHLSDLDPSRAGLEVFAIHERPGHGQGITFRAAATGEVLWSRRSRDVARGMSADIDADHPGSECWAAGPGLESLYSAGGQVISGRRPRSCNMAVWWDGDRLRELLDGTRITKWDAQSESESVLLSARELGCESNNGTKANPCLVADIIGDWREEVVWRTSDNHELRVFTTTIPAETRRTTLLHDRVYRLGIAWQNAGYNQPPHLGWVEGGAP